MKNINNKSKTVFDLKPDIYYSDLWDDCFCTILEFMQFRACHTFVIIKSDIIYMLTRRNSQGNTEHKRVEFMLF